MDAKKKQESKQESPNEHISDPIDTPVGYAPRVVKVPMHDNADVNPKFHEAKEKEKAMAKPEPNVKKGMTEYTGAAAHASVQTPSVVPSPVAPKPGFQSAPQALPTQTPAATPAHEQTHAVNKSIPNVTLLLKGGPGSRGGKIVRHTASGKPVYESQAKKQAEQSDRMMQNWHNNASRSDDPEHHAIAAKQALHAAYFHHHAGDEVASHQAMDYASHHRAAYEKVNHKSRTTNAVEKLHHKTAEEVGHAGWLPEEHGLDHAHSVAQDARKEGKSKEADESREQAGHRENRAGSVIGKTRSGKPIHGPSKKVLDAQAKYQHARNKSSGGTASESDYEKFNKVLHDHIASTSKDYTAEDHHDAAVAHHQRNTSSESPASNPNASAHGSLSARHNAARDHLDARSPRNSLVPHHIKNDPKITNQDSGLSHRETARNASTSARNATETASQSQTRGSHIDAQEAHEHAAEMHHNAGFEDSARAHTEQAAKHKQESETALKKAITPSNSIGGNMSKKNEASDLFKAELGADAKQPVTACVHCEKPLTSEDLHKGLTTHFVADDNDQPHDGGSGSVEVMRPGAGVAENDVIAPLLKSCKGPDAGDKEEYPINKSEMAQMGMNVEKLDDGWYTISKSEMKRLGMEKHIAYLDDRKKNVAKSLAPSVNVTPASRRQTNGPHGFTPRAGGVHGPGGESLVQWTEGSDKEIAKYIEQSGNYGQGNDESIRTQGRGEH